MESQDIWSEIEYLLHFLPINYIAKIIIPATNDCPKTQKPQWVNIDLDDFLHFLGIFISMEVFEIHRPCRLYWSKEDNFLFLGRNFGKIMTRTRLEEMEKYMHLSFDDDHDKQILAFLEAGDSFRVL